MKEIKTVKFILDLGKDKKEVYFIGEIHAYNKEESEWSRKLLYDENIKNVLFEGFDDDANLGLIGRIGRFLLMPYTNCIALIQKRNSKTLKELCKEKGVGISYLEESTPLATQIFLLVGGFIIWALPLYMAYLVLVEGGDVCALCALAIKIFVVLLAYVILKDRISPIKNSAYAISKRNESMIDNLKKKLSSITASKILIVVGRSHFDGMIDLISREFTISESIYKIGWMA
jgi:hypothetical protein